MATAKQKIKSTLSKAAKKVKEMGETVVEKTKKTVRNVEAKLGMTPARTTAKVRK